MTHTPSIMLLLQILLWTVIVTFKGQAIFKQYILKKYIHFGIQIYKLCDISGYTYDMGIICDMCDHKYDSKTQL